MFDVNRSNEVSVEVEVPVSDVSAGRERWADIVGYEGQYQVCLLYTSPSPRDQRGSRMPSSA